MRMRIKKHNYKERLTVFSSKRDRQKTATRLSLDDLHQSVDQSRKGFDEELLLTTAHLADISGGVSENVVQQNISQLDLFALLDSLDSNEAADDTVSVQEQDVLGEYMKQLDLAFDTNPLEGLPSMLALEENDPLDDFSLRFLEPDSPEMQDLMKKFQSLVQARPQTATIENVLDQLEEKTAGDRQIVIDRSDVITRVLKARSEDPLSVVVPSPKRLQ